MATTATAPTTTAFSGPRADGRYEMVDATTGRVRASMAAYAPSTLGDAQLPCADQEPPDPTLLACMVVPSPGAGSTKPQRLWTARSGQVTLSPPLHVRLTALQVADGYLLAGSPGFPDYQDGWTVLDRAGTTVARVGGTVLALDDGYAVVRTGQDSSTRYAVYHLDH